MSTPFIRLARQDDVSRMAEIETSAATLFQDAGIAIYAEETPEHHADITPAEVWRPIVEAGLVWVAELDGSVVAFLAGRLEPDSLHVLEFDVHREAQGRGIGRRLLGVAIAEARRRGLAGLSLTTFRDVPWNAPFYASAGFAIVGREAAPAWLTAYLDREAERGLDPARRCAMSLRF